MRPKLFSVAWVLSMLLCIASAALCMRSFWNDSEVPCKYRGERCRAWVRSGRLGIDNEPEVQAQIEKERLTRETVSSMPGFGLLVFVPRADTIMNPPSRVPPRWSHSSAIPLPAAVVLLAIFPLRAGWRLSIRHRRRNRGLCTSCGYDLTGNVSGVCPECGAAVPLIKIF